MTSPSQCQCRVCSSSCRMTAAVDTTDAVTQFLAGLSPASAPTAAASCCWCVLLLAVLLSLSSVHVPKWCFVCWANLCRAWIFSNSYVSQLSPLGFFVCHSCVDSQMSLRICAVFRITFRLFL